MKKVIAVLSFALTVLLAQGQVGGTFPSVDSLRKYNNRYFRNSAIDVFSNLRGNTINNGVINFLDSARLSWGGSRDTLQTRLGVRVDSTGPNKIRVEYRGSSFTNTADLRAFSGTINTTYVYRVKNDSTISDFYYDSLDNTSADNGVTVIVNGSKRLKLQETVIDAVKFGMKADGTTDNTPVFIKIFSLLNATKNLANKIILLPAGTISTDTLRPPNSSSYWTLRGQGKFITQLVYRGSAAGRDFLRCLNPQRVTIEDLELVGKNGSQQIPEAMIRFYTDNTIVGNQGMIGHNVIRNVLIRGSVGIYNYGIVYSCSPDHDQNNEQNKIINCEVESAEKTALSIEMVNSLWNTAWYSLFSGKKVAVNLSKLNPGGSVDSSGGGLSMYGCTAMSLSVSDTLYKVVGCQLILHDPRSEGSGKCIVYSRKSAEGTYAIVTMDGGSITVGTANGGAGEYHFDVSGTFFTLDNSRISGLVKGRFTDSTTFAKFLGPVLMDSIWYSSHVWMENAGGVTGGVNKATQLYTDKGSFHLINSPRDFVNYTVTGSQTIDVSGQSVFGLNPASALSVEGFTGKPPADKFTIITYNGNTTIKNNANIVTPTGADMVLPANSAITFIRQDEALGGVWVMVGVNYHSFFSGLSNNTIAKWSTSSNKFVNSGFTDDGSTIVTGEALLVNGGYFTTNGYFATNAGDQSLGFTHTSTSTTGYASVHLVNNSSYALDMRLHGSAHSKANIATIFSGAPGGLELNTYDGGGTAGPIILTPNGSEKLRADGTGIKFTLGSDVNYDIYYRGSSGYLVRLANGTSGQFLGANTGAAPSWQSPSGGTTIYSGNASLAGNRVVDGSASNFSLRFGDFDASKHLSQLRVDANDIYLNGAVRVNVAIASDANYSVTATDYIIHLPTITAGRTITLPSAASFSGRVLVFKNKNSTGNTWQFGTAVKDGADGNVTNLVNDTVYRIYSDGTDWNIEN